MQWPDGKVTANNEVTINQTLTIRYADSKPVVTKPTSQQSLFSEITMQTSIDYRHKENPYNDFKREMLLPHKQSEHGPYVAVGDVNGDQLEDFFVGGAAGSAGQLFIQTANQKFVAGKSQPWELQAQSEDLGVLLFDADNDKDLDLYVTSGGNEFDKNNPLYGDRLYINDGLGGFEISDKLPKLTSSGLRVVAGDYDGDGDQDLFVGGRVVPGKYPLAPNSYLLKNEHGQFIDVTQEIAAEISTIGMVTDADFVDYDNDGDVDLLLVGEWMSFTVFENQKGHFVDVTAKRGLSSTSGWWQTLEHGDFDNDGDMDFVAGNIGNNNKFQPSQSKPLNVYANDFDSNGSLDIILATNKNNRDLPIRGRQCSAEQIPGLSSKFPTFKAFAEADLPSIYSTAKLTSALNLKAQVFASVLFINNGQYGFEMRALPNTAQMAPISGIVIDDFNDDNHLDILYTGNLYGAEVETARYDAGIGGLLLGDGALAFKAVKPNRSGFITPGNARDLQPIKIGQGKQSAVIVSNNNDELQFFKQN